MRIIRAKLSLIFFLVIARYTKQVFQFAAAELGNPNRAAFSDMFDPVDLK